MRERREREQESNLEREGGTRLLDSLLNLFRSNLNMVARAPSRRKRGATYSTLPQQAEEQGRKEEAEQPEQEPSSPGSSLSSHTTTSSYQPALERLALLREEDFDWGEEELTCNVCDRSFDTPWHLESHMVKRRHWG